MIKVFTQNVGRFKKGDIRDYPVPVWKQIEHNAGMGLDEFTKSHDQAIYDAVHPETSSEPMRRRGRPMKVN